MPTGRSWWSATSRLSAGPRRSRSRARRPTGASRKRASGGSSAATTRSCCARSYRRTLFGLLHPLEEVLAELRDFRLHDECAVGLVGIAAEIFLVVVLGGMERRRRGDLGDDGTVVDLRAVEPGDHFFRRLLLL